MGQKVFKPEKLERAAIDWETRIRQLREQSNWHEGDEVTDYNRDGWHKFQLAQAMQSYTRLLRECAAQGEQHTRQQYESYKEADSKELHHTYEARVEFASILKDNLP